MHLWRWSCYAYTSGCAHDGLVHIWSVAIVESLEQNSDNLDLELNFILSSEGCGEFFFQAFSSWELINLDIGLH
jgi:hypothetical protein